MNTKHTPGNSMPGLARACDIGGCPTCGSAVNTTVITSHRCLSAKCGWSQCGNTHDAIYNPLAAKRDRLKAVNAELLAALEVLFREVAELVSEKTLPEAALSHPSMIAARQVIAKAKG